MPRDASADHTDLEDAMKKADRKYLIEDPDSGELTLEVTWAELAEVNDPEVMDEIAEIPAGELTGVGHSRIKRIA